MNRRRVAVLTGDHGPSLGQIAPRDPIMKRRGGMMYSVLNASVLQVDDTNEVIRLVFRTA